MSQHWIKPEEVVALAGLDDPITDEFLSRLWRYFCRPNKKEGRCKECRFCQASLQRIFRPFERAKDPAAIIVWRCRDAVAQLVESEHEHVGQPGIDIFDQPIDRNPFEALMSEL